MSQLAVSFFTMVLLIMIVSALCCSQHATCLGTHVGFHIDLGSAATMDNVTASRCVLFHSCATNHDRARADFDFAAINEMATETQMERSAILKHHTIDDALLELARLLTGKQKTLLDPTKERMEGVCQHHR